MNLFLRLAAAAVLALSPLAAGCTTDDSTAGEEQDVTSSAGRFETFKGADGKHYFHLLAGNHEKVLHSQGYSSASAAKKGIESVKKNAVDAKSFKILEAVNGEWYFNIVAGNGAIVGTSETYDSKSNAQRGADAVKKLVVKQLRVEAAETGGAHFSVFQGRDGDAYFNLRAANGEIVLQSEGYEDASGAEGATESVRENGRDEASYELFELDNGQAYFVLAAKNGETIARSEIYASVSNAQRGLETVAGLIASEKVADAE
jgi:uncharacterized protein YegP (UPF0339 family)